MTRKKKTRWKWLDLIIVKEIMCMHETCEWANACMHRDGGRGSCTVFYKSMTSVFSHNVNYEMSLDATDTKWGSRKCVFEPCTSILYHLYLCLRLLFIWIWINDSKWKQLQLEMEEQLSVRENRRYLNTDWSPGKGSCVPHKSFFFWFSCCSCRKHPLTSQIVGLDLGVEVGGLGVKEEDSSKGVALKKHSINKWRNIL